MREKINAKIALNIRLEYRVNKFLLNINQRDRAQFISTQNGPPPKQYFPMISWHLLEMMIVMCFWGREQR